MEASVQCNDVADGKLTQPTRKRRSCSDRQLVCASRPSPLGHIGQSMQFQDMVWGTGLFCPRMARVDESARVATADAFGAMAGDTEPRSMGGALGKVVCVCVRRAVRGGGAPSASVFSSGMEARYPLSGRRGTGGADEMPSASASVSTGDGVLLTAVRGSCRMEITALASGGDGASVACALVRGQQTILCTDGGLCGVAADVSLYDHLPSVQWSGRVCSAHALWIWSHWLLYQLPLIAYHSTRMLLLREGDTEGSVAEYAHKLEHSAGRALEFIERCTAMANRD